MKPAGSYKIRYQRGAHARSVRPTTASEDPIETLLAEVAESDHRVRRIVESLRDEILDAGESAELRVRRVFSSPREIFRLEIERPEFGYLRTTLLDREALEALLETDEVRHRVAAVA
ncbi:MAG: hypothetical protein AAF430_14650 [Myxococcota bacterium]